MPSNKLKSRLGIYITLLVVTKVANASSIYMKSPLCIQSWKSRSHETNRPCTEISPLFLRESNYFLRFRGGSDRGSGYGSGARDNDYNYGDRDHATSRSESQHHYEDDYYGKRNRNEISYDDRYYDQNDDHKREEYDDYRRDKNDDYRRDKKSPRKYTKSSSMNYLPDIIRNGNKKIGFALLGGGVVFTLLGITLFFNKTLMRLGNLLIIAGIPMTIGPGRTSGYFLQPKKARATGCLALGIFLVMIGWPIVGIILEIFGILNLFGNMFPLLKVLLKQVPVVGGIFDGGSKSKKSRKPQKRNYDDDRDYYSGHDDERYGGGEREAANRYGERDY